MLKGAYARLPRYFKDADRVMDLETRLLHCMTTLQGRSREEATKRVFGNENAPSEMEYLSAYVAAQSRGAKMAPGTSHPKEKESYELGRQALLPPRRPLGLLLRELPWRGRQAHPHAGPAGALQARVRARPVVATWPAYRVSNSQFKTMQWRINDCYRQMRMPEPNYASDATVALTTFLTVTAQGRALPRPGNQAMKVAGFPAARCACRWRSARRRPT